MSVKIIGPKDKHYGKYINTTSISDTWSCDLSPFKLGPVSVPCSPSSKILDDLHTRIKSASEGKKILLKKILIGMSGSIISHNVENAWQYSKVYECHDDGGEPSREWFGWRSTGCAQKHAVRYPFGKNKKPLYIWWGGKKYSYIEARRNVYIPLYVNAVKDTNAYMRLRGLYTAGDIVLWDFDGYDSHSLGMTYDQVIDSENKKMGHAFVLAMMLDGFIK